MSPIIAALLTMKTWVDMTLQERWSCVEGLIGSSTSKANLRELLNRLGVHGSISWVEVDQDDPSSLARRDRFVERGGTLSSTGAMVVVKSPDLEDPSADGHDQGYPTL